MPSPPAGASPGHPPGPAPLPCPGCSASLSPAGAQSCPRCGLPLIGPLAGRLWHIDQQLRALAEERADVLARLRAGPGAPSEVWAVPATAGRVAVAPRGPSGQRLLLGLGVAALLVAAIVFLAVAWDLLGVYGQVLVMAGLTGAAGAGAFSATRRGLPATGEALAALALGLAVLDIGAARALGLGSLDRLDREVYATVGAGLLAGLAAVAWRADRRISAFGLGTVLAAAAVPLLGTHAADLGPAPASLAALAAAAIAAAGYRALPPSAARSLAAVVVSGYTALAVAAGVAAAAAGPAGPAAMGTLSVLLVAAGGALWAQRRTPGDLRAAGGLLAAFVAALVLTVDVAHAGPVAVTALAVAGALLLAGAVLAGRYGVDVRLRMGTGGLGLALAGLGLAALDEDGSASQQSVVLFAVAVAFALAAVELPAVRDTSAGAAGLAALLATGLATEGRDGARVAALLAGALLLLAVAAARHGRDEELALAATAALGALASLGVAYAADLRVPGLPWPALSAALAVAGLAGFGYALLPDRGLAAFAGVAGVSGATWVALADADVHVVEAYSLPLALLVGLVGLIRLRREPDAPSWATTGPACSAALLPSAVASLDDPGFLRAGVVLLAATLVVVAGVARRWQAPTITGSAALGIVLISQFGPYAVGLPRWLTLGLVGAALLAVGARYEQRRADVTRAAAWVGGLR